MSSRSNKRFKIGETVLCHHLSSLYEGKILNSKVAGSEVQYFIQFSDVKEPEWLDGALVVKDNKDNRLLKAKMESENSATTNEIGTKDQDHQQQQSTEKTLDASSMNEKRQQESEGNGGELEEEDSTNDENQSKSKKKQRTSTTSSRKRKRTYHKVEPVETTKKHKRSKSDEKMDEDNKQQQTTTIVKIQLSLPKILKNILVEDYRRCTERKQTYKLPAEHTIDSIMNKYLEYVKSSSQTEDEVQISESVSNGVKEYFNALLRKVLLYPCEKKDHDIFFKKSKEAQPSSVYGLEHLLRFYVKLPQFLNRLGIREEGCAMIKEKSQLFFDWLVLEVH